MKGEGGNDYAISQEHDVIEHLYVQTLCKVAAATLVGLAILSASLNSHPLRFNDGRECYGREF